jgi:hypothetical protein
MKITITIRDVKIELEDNSDNSISYCIKEVKEIISLSIQEYNTIKN